ncbi:hypothetical protein ACIGMX_03320 [Streptomyces aquilus]|uniref:Uncharacterized protein n=1 Tax=Streptomyces aquilus TaxID=2548456 RepID=A0A3S9ICL9_9ACTN|nr:hypothetical protein [Streptomyces aquilus]AZP22116.1 hypothetical protein EJC51_42155 [Streptomyces aquilus]
MFQDSPIYDRLIAERGDIPTQVRREAERVSRELEFAMQPLQSIGRSQLGELPPPPPPPPGWQRNALMPGPGQL